MTAPAYQSTTTTDFGSDVTSHPANMPATVNVNDLLLAFVCFDASGTTITTPSDWTNLIGVGGDPVAGVYAKKAAGTEGGTTVDFATSNAQQGTVQVIRITGWANDISTLSACSSFTGSTAVLGMAPSTSTHDYLVICSQAKSAAGAFGATPTGYSNETKSGQNATTGGAVATATKTVSAANQADVNPLWTNGTLPAFLIFVSPDAPASGSGGPVQLVNTTGLVA